jgi:hypothetical protein
MYLYLKEINRTHNMVIDQKNGMPTKGYEEISAAYWNLIYKDGNRNNRASGDAEDLNIAIFDNDISIGSNGNKNYIQFDFGFPGGVTAPPTAGSFSPFGQGVSTP